MKNALTNCKWIAAPKSISSPVILKKINISAFKKATLIITGLGYFEAKINGKTVTDYMLLPVASDYEPRDFSLFAHKSFGTTTNRIYYYEFDITHLLNDGDNILSVQLGNGWYRQDERIAEGETSYGDTLKCIFKIVIDDAEFCSDGSETYTNSNITYNNLYHGEIIDFTATISQPKVVNIVAAPSSELSKAIGAPDRVIRKITPLKIGKINGRQIFDAGENITGIASVTTTAQKGSVITLRFAENINDDFSLNFKSANCWCNSRSGKEQIMQDTFITDGAARTFTPKFVWHSFRYIEIDGMFDNIEIFVIHSDTAVNSSFNSNCEGLNFLYDAYIRTQLDNMHGSFPSDCPHRERLGYTGDGQITAPAVMLTLDSREFYKKWIQDILDCQDIDGHVRHTAPFMGGGGGPGGWGSAITFVPYAFYKHYGDLDILKGCYGPMKKWIEYLSSRCENGLITYEDEGGWCLGDWCTLEKTIIPESFVNTCYFIKNLIIIKEIATILGKTQDIARFDTLKTISENAVKETFYNAESDTFAGGVQGADAYAVWCGLAGKKTAAKLAKKYNELGHFDTGFLCTDILCGILFEYGFGDTFLKLLQSEDMGSFLYMKRHGATTIWETWDGTQSHNHPMFGACTRQLFTGVLGIKQRTGTVGYRDVIIDPVKTTYKLRASGSITTPNGVITVSLDTTGEKVIINVDAPKTIKVEIKN